MNEIITLSLTVAAHAFVAGVLMGVQGTIGYIAWKQAKKDYELEWMHLWVDDG